MATGVLKGKRILVTGGTAREVIDGVRHYTNYTRPGDLGHRTAWLLAKEGAEVTLVSTRTTLPPPEGVTLHGKSLSTADLLETCQKFIEHKEPDLLLHLANTPCFKATNPSNVGVKFRVSGKDDVELDTVTQRDFINCFELPTRLGFNRYQNRVGTGDRALTEAAEAIVKKAQEMPTYGITPQRMSMRTDLPQVLTGRKAIVTAGATVEKLTASGDVITQFASARQGMEIAAALAGMGAEVVLVTGRTSRNLPQHPNITHQRVDSCFELLAMLQTSMPADIYIGTAAITPFASMQSLEQLPKEDSDHKLILSRVPHVLDLIGHLPVEQRPSVVICFTGGTGEKHIEALRHKLGKSQIDAICAIPIDRRTRSKLGTDKTRVRWVSELETADWGIMSKADVGLRLGKELISMLAFAQAKRA